MKKFQIYDGEKTSIFSDYPEIEARTGKEAILKLLEDTGRNYKIKRSASNNVLFSATQFYIGEDGRKYKKGNSVWYEIIY